LPDGTEGEIVNAKTLRRRGYLGLESVTPARRRMMELGPYLRNATIWAVRDGDGYIFVVY